MLKTMIKCFTISVICFLLQMRLEEDDGTANAEPPTEEDVTQFVSADQELRRSTYVRVKSNMDIAQKKQQEQYYKRMSKGVKSFNLSQGDVVYKRSMKNLTRKGGKMDPKWSGPYRILHIDSSKRVKLLNIKTNSELKGRSAWDQLKPEVVSDLHNFDNDQMETYHNEDVHTVKVAQNDQVVEDADTHSNSIDLEDMEIQTHDYLSSQVRFRSLVGSTAWLSSDEIDDFSELLKKSEKLAGLQSTLLFSYEHCHHLIKAMPEDKPFVQTLIKGGNHWICISNVQSSLDVCTVYDSGFTLYRYTPEDMKMLNLKIAMLFKTKNDFVQVRFADVKQQTDGHSCGFFALAYSASLIGDNDPRREDYIQENLRQHASDCIEKGELSMFPKNHLQRNHNGYFEEYQIDIHCICRLPARENMITCTSCLKQFHSDCITFSSTGIYVLILMLFQTFLVLKNTYFS